MYLGSVKPIGREGERCEEKGDDSNEEEDTGKPSGGNAVDEEEDACGCW
jgi:hypothetical protein